MNIDYYTNVYLYFFQQKHWFTLPWDQPSSVIQWEEDVRWRPRDPLEHKQGRKLLYFLLDKFIVQSV